MGSFNSNIERGGVREGGWGGQGTGREGGNWGIYFLRLSAFSLVRMGSTTAPYPVLIYFALFRARMNPLNFNITERSRGDYNNRIPSEMNRSMVSTGNAISAGNYTARTPRLSHLLPEDRQMCEEIIFEGKGAGNSSMILGSKRSRKNS